MHTELEQYIRRTARARGLALSEVARRAGLSRQALYDAWRPDHYPSMNTILTLAQALEVHPLALLDALFRDHPDCIPASERESGAATDRSSFLGDASYPDGSQITAGSRFRKAWTLQNVGDTPWLDRFLVCQDDHVRIIDEQRDDVALAPSLMPDRPWVAIPPTRPGEEVTVEVDFTAPTVPTTAVSYWKMAYADGTLCFPGGYGVWVKVTVITPVGAARRNDPERLG